jgi:hypothetical protein
MDDGDRCLPRSLDDGACVVLCAWPVDRPPIARMNDDDDDNDDGDDDDGGLVVVVEVVVVVVMAAMMRGVLCVRCE